MQQSLLNAECDSGEYLNAGEKTMHVCGGMKALTKESRQTPGSFSCIYPCRQLKFLGYKRVRELEDCYDISVGRELKVKELQDEIEALKKELKE